MPWGSHQGGVPISHNALQHFPECHGAATGGVPCQVQPGGYPGRGVPCPGGVPRSGNPPPPARSGGGGTQLGQHREYLLHGGRYASCVHAGGLSCKLEFVEARHYTQQVFLLLSLCAHVNLKSGKPSTLHRSEAEVAPAWQTHVNEDVPQKLSCCLG